MKRLWMALMLALLAFGGAAAQEAPSFRVSQRHTLDIGVVERVYSVYVPESLEGAAPLLVALHGRFRPAKPSRPIPISRARRRKRLDRRLSAGASVQLGDGGANLACRARR